MFRRVQHTDKQFWNSQQSNPQLDYGELVKWEQPFTGYAGRPLAQPLFIDSYAKESEYIGWWIRQKYRALARLQGTRAVATRLRKQGWPLHLTLLVLS